MTNAAAAAASATPGAGGIPFTIASRPQKRLGNVQTVNNLAAGGTFNIIPLPATGWVRKVQIYVEATYTTSASAALVAGDAPWNLLTGITLTDATGQPVLQPISGYNLYLVDKYLSSGVDTPNNGVGAFGANPHLGPEYALAASGTSGTAKFRLDIDFEIDRNTGYGCIPNLDSNASLQLKVDYAAITAAFTGGTASAGSLSIRVDQYYWAPVGKTLNGAPVDIAPPGAGDYVETRYETQPVSALSENLVNFTNRGGLVKGVLLVSRAAGVRTALTGTNPLGVILDNQPIDEGILLNAQYDFSRRAYGYLGADLTTSYAPLTAGVLPGLDTGVVPLPFFLGSGYRDSWLNTRVGSLLQAKVTPGASATQLEIITQLAQVKDMTAFYARS